MRLFSSDFVLHIRGNFPPAQFTECSRAAEPVKSFQVPNTRKLFPELAARDIKLLCKLLKLLCWLQGVRGGGVCGHRVESELQRK